MFLVNNSEQLTLKLYHLYKVGLISGKYTEMKHKKSPELQGFLFNIHLH